MGFRGVDYAFKKPNTIIPSSFSRLKVCAAKRVRRTNNVFIGIRTQKGFSWTLLRLKLTSKCEHNCFFYIYKYMFVLKIKGYNWSHNINVKCNVCVALQLKYEQCLDRWSLYIEWLQIQMKWKAITCALLCFGLLSVFAQFNDIKTEVETVCYHHGDKQRDTDRDRDVDVVTKMFL